MNKREPSLQAQSANYSPESGQNFPILANYLPSWFKEFAEKFRPGEGETPDKAVSGLRSLFPRQADKTLSPCPALQDLPALDQHTQDYLVNADNECRLMSDFVDRTRDFIRCRQTTVNGPEQRNFEWKEFSSEWYTDFRGYLEKHGFFENMVNVLCKMFILHPCLPDDPIQYIRDNYGVNCSEETELVRRWNLLADEVESLRAENSELKLRLEAARAACVPDQQRPSYSRKTSLLDKRSTRNSLRLGSRLSRQSRGSKLSKLNRPSAKDCQTDYGLNYLVWKEVCPSGGPHTPSGGESGATSSTSDYSLTSGDSVS